jgi:hypothetical protein
MSDQDVTVKDQQYLGYRCLNTFVRYVLSMRVFTFYSDADNVVHAGT